MEELDHRYWQLANAVNAWLRSDPLLPGDTVESLADELAASYWLPVAGATSEELVPIIRTHLAGRKTASRQDEARRA